MFYIAHGFCRGGRVSRDVCRRAGNSRGRRRSLGFDWLLGQCLDGVVLFAVSE